jgi:hypothetical protein
MQLVATAGVRQNYSIALNGRQSDLKGATHYYLVRLWGMAMDWWIVGG